MRFLKTHLSKIPAAFVITIMMLCSPAFAVDTAVNINFAPAEVLEQTLKGVGEKRAKAIVEYRETNGNFENISDLLKVKGIGEQTLKLNQGLIVVDGESES